MGVRGGEGDGEGGSVIINNRLLITSRHNIDSKTLYYCRNNMM